MRVSKFGKNVSLRDEVVDIITDALPHEKGEVESIIESFLNSRDMDKMVDSILEAVEEHIDYNVDSRRIVE